MVVRNTSAFRTSAMNSSVSRSKSVHKIYISSIANSAMPKSRKLYSNMLYLHFLREVPPQMREFLVCRNAGNKQAIFVAHRHTANNSGIADRGVYDWDVLGQLCLENTVEILRAPHRCEAIRICQACENTDLTAALKSRTDSH
mmetsp:Transcript_133897/g.267223  ORF Transcript_133897/g.267223 Transcript_133897/m.267223 type:complete len:143 (-) Transcript_133897:56-484(-)